jgi:FlaA1/EpsC-like NDP-sugar epimerase
MVVYGAGEEGASTLRVLRAEANGSRLRPVAVVDDTPDSRGTLARWCAGDWGLARFPGL